MKKPKIQFQITQVAVTLHRCR